MQAAPSLAPVSPVVPLPPSPPQPTAASARVPATMQRESARASMIPPGARERGGMLDRLPLARVAPMHAWRGHAFGPPESLAWEEAADPPLGEGQVRVEVKAAAVNFPDVLYVAG